MPNSTLKEVALEAGVSISTVSRVINGSARVAPEKERVVLETVRRLGYHPNPSARGLVRGKTMGIGVLAQEIWGRFNERFLAGFEAELHSTSFHPVYVSSNWQAEDEKALLKVLARYPIDALVVVGGSSNEDNLRSLAKRLPLVAVGRSIAGLERQCMTFDHELGGHLATKHLLELGHTRVAKLHGLKDRQDAILRHQGYKRALVEAGLAYDPALVVEGHYYEGGGYRAVASLLESKLPFTAIFAGNDQMAYGARLALYERGVRVPEDVSIVGFDDLPASAFMTPPLTTVRHLSFDLGRVAARSAIALLEHQHLELAPITVELALRKSTAPLMESLKEVVQFARP